LAELLGADGTSESDQELALIKQELLSLGEGAAAPLLARLRNEPDSARRDLLLDFLRKIPGPAVENQLISDARAGAGGSTRSIAMDALAERGTDAALQALGDIATADPELPRYPLVTSHLRSADELNTELPDEVNYTPRMKAMVALASTEDERVVPTLLRILQRERDESLRMRAAGHLTGWHTAPVVREALRDAAARDASRYVRLAALRALDGSGDPGLGQLLTELAARDVDAGVRLLARRLLHGGDEP
jgi:HEAT repeat protein